MVGPHVPAHLRGAADLPLLRPVDADRQRLQRRAFHPVVCEARVVVPALLRRRRRPRRAAGQATRVGDGGVAGSAPRIVAVDIVDRVARDGGA